MKSKKDTFFQIRYSDLVRLIEINDLKRFQTVAVKCDLNSLQIGNKPFLFITIRKDDRELTEFLLQREIDLNTRYTVEIVPPTDEEEGVYLENILPLEYAQYLKRYKICEQIINKMNDDPVDERWIRVLERHKNNLEAVESFLRKFPNPAQSSELVEIGLIKAAESGSLKLIDFFLNEYDADVNCVRVLDGIKTTPLLTAIANKKTHIAKYLIFRKADMFLVGEYGDALVSSVHFDAPPELITLLLEKGATLSSRHLHWPSLNLREYCVNLNKVKAKSVIDEFIFKLIANGEYEKLRALVETGYISINVTNRFRKTGRDLAIERNQVAIVQLIDKIEEQQRKLKTKMNYK